MIALRRNATAVTHEDLMEAINEVQAKKKANLNYYAWIMQKYGKKYDSIVFQSRKLIITKEVCYASIYLYL